MPYVIAFTKALEVDDDDVYFNDCCWGGDVVTDQLVPAINGRYEDVEHNQEDWGWFIWFQKGRTSLAVDVFCDAPDEGVFRILLTSSRKRWMVLDQVVDTPELEELKSLVLGELETWSDSPCRVKKVDSSYLP